jgi:hypothetical protein
MKYLAMLLICQSALSQFQIGDSVAVGIQAVDCTSLRGTATTSAPTVKCEPVGQKGKVLAGPTADINGSSTIIFWQVSFIDNLTGWVAGKNLVFVSGGVAPPTTTFHEADSVAVNVSCANVWTSPHSWETPIRCYPLGTKGRLLRGPSTDSLGVVFWHVYFSDSTSQSPVYWCAVSDLIVTKPFPIIVGQIPTATLKANPTSVSSLGSSVVTLTWTTQNATSVGLAGWSGYWDLNGSHMFSITYSQTITLMATNVYGMVQVPVTILVTTPPPIAPVFAIGSRVVVSSTLPLNIRTVPSTSGNQPSGTEKPGQQGKITSGPGTASGFTWWNIQWNDGKSGWSAESYLTPVAALPPLTYPSIADKYDTVTISSQGNIDPILLYNFHIRMGCADTVISLPQLYFAVPNPAGFYDTTYFTGTYHFTKPKNSVER